MKKITPSSIYWVVGLILLLNTNAHAQLFSEHRLFVGVQYSSISNSITYTEKNVINDVAIYHGRSIRSFLNGTGFTGGYNVAMGKTLRLGWAAGFSQGEHDLIIRNTFIMDNQRTVTHNEFWTIAQLSLPIFRKKKASAYFSAGVAYTIHKLRYTSEIDFSPGLNIILREVFIREKNDHWGLPISISFEVPIKNRLKLSLDTTFIQFGEGLNVLNHCLGFNYQLGTYIKTY